jgi:hypothetical protein
VEESAYCHVEELRCSRNFGDSTQVASVTLDHGSSGVLNCCGSYGNGCYARSSAPSSLLVEEEGYKGAFDPESAELMEAIEKSLITMTIESNCYANLKAASALSMDKITRRTWILS